MFAGGKLLLPDVQVLVSIARLDFFLIYMMIHVLQWTENTFSNVSAYLKLHVLFPPLICMKNEVLLAYTAFITAIMYVSFLIHS